jgi:hypothetical protein
VTESAESAESAEPEEPAAVPDLAGEPAVVRRRRYPSTIGGTFYLAVLAAAGISILVVVFGDWRFGVRVLGTALLTAGVLRLVLPQRDAGMLAVRRRSVDVLLLVVVGALLWWLAGSIPDQP